MSNFKIKHGIYFDGTGDGGHYEVWIRGKLVAIEWTGKAASAIFKHHNKVAV